ncbi:MAG: ABC transporter permease, partial [Pseudorhodoplanes sp.]
MKILLRVIVAATIIFLMLPLVFVIISSFGASALMVFPPKSYTLDWYRNIPTPFLNSLKVSLIVATVTAFIATIVGTGAAMALSRGRFAGLRTLGVFTLSPLMVPTIVSAVALFQFTGLFWDITGIELAGTLMGIIMGHTAYAIPYVVRAVVAGHSHFDYSLEEAALSLGASRLRTVLSITLPVLLPGIVSGTLFAFLISLDDLPIALFMTGGECTTTLPVKIYTTIEYSLNPDVMAISSILIFGSLALVILLDRT